jgi:hypothetical protein
VISADIEGGAGRGGFNVQTAIMRATTMTVKFETSDGTKYKLAILRGSDGGLFGRIPGMSQHRTGVEELASFLESTASGGRGHALRRALASAGLAPDVVVLTGEPDPGDSAPPGAREGPWLIVPYRDVLLVGGVGRGEFLTYEPASTFDDAIRLAIELTKTPGPSQVLQRHEDLAAHSRATVDRMQERVRRREGDPAPAELVAGDVLDCYEHETGHHLYAAGTPWPERAQPPGDAQNPYRLYGVRQPFPPTVHEGTIVPWFDQPGGGAMVVLDRPIRWYADRGYIVELRVPA